MKPKDIIEMRKPSKEELDFHIDRWKGQKKYQDQETAIEELFKFCPGNSDITKVLLKVSVLNDFYSTNIYDTYAVAKRIISIEELDKKISNGDQRIVDEIKAVEIGNTEIHFYSFATKYCSFHQQEKYPIYDKFVAKALYFFESKFHFYNSAHKVYTTNKNGFTQDSLKCYQTFKGIIDTFIKYYQLNECSYKEIDQYLWQIGKDIITIDDKIISLYETGDKNEIKKNINEELRLEIADDYISKIIEKSIINKK